MPDYSCYITIQNNSDVDLLLTDFGIVDEYGVWPLYQPLNTIEAGSSGQVHLKDPDSKSSFAETILDKITDFWRSKRRFRRLGLI